MLLEDILSIPISLIAPDKVSRIKVLGRESISDPGALAWSPYGLAWSSGFQITLLNRGQRCYLNGHSSYIARITFSSDFKRLASGGYDFTVRLWDVETCKEKIVLSDHQNMVIAVAFSPNGTFLVTAGSEERSIKLRDGKTGNLLGQFLAPESDSCVSAEFSPDSRFLVAADLAAKVWLWDVQTGELVNVGDHDDMVSDVTFSPSGNLVASVSHDGSVRLWQQDLSTLYDQFNVGMELFCVAFHPTGELLAAGDIDGRIHLWDVEARQKLTILKEHTRTIADISFNPSGTLLASVSTDGSIILWGQERS